MSTTAMPNKIHEGRNVKRLREILGIKQEVLADELGWTQQKISLLEAKETIDDDILEQVAQALKVPADAIKSFSEEATVNFIANTYTDNAASHVHYYNINPIEKWIEALEENKKLYERLLQTEREKVALLERLLPKQ